MTLHQCLLACTMLCCLGSFAQTNNGNTGPIIPVSIQDASNFASGLQSRFSKLNQEIYRKTGSYLRKLEKKESKLYTKLYKKDSATAKKLLSDRTAFYQLMRNNLNNADSSQKKLKEYIPRYDTLQSSLVYLEKNIPVNAQLQAAKSLVNQYGSRMQVANEIKRQLRERKQVLNKQLEQFGMVKELKAINKEVYYYQQQLNEYKAMLTDRKKAEQKVIALLKENSLFKDFMQRNSLLAQLFKLPEGYGTTESLAGLQTVTSVQQMINGRASGPNAQQAFNQGMGQAQAQLKALRNKINSFGGSSSSMDMPKGFQPNAQHTKSFLQRLEYGLNFQTLKQHGILPVTTDAALTVGYKLSDRNIIGIGASYKLGWGNGLKDIQLSSQGLGIRSFMDIKLKGSIWVTGGYEMNYQHAFTKYDQLRTLSAWQRSGLIGMTKKYMIGRKQHQAQLLWDFLSYQQRPLTPAIKFRIGYKL